MGTAGRWFAGLRTLILCLAALAGGVWIVHEHPSPTLLLAWGAVSVSILGCVIGGKGWASFPEVLRAGAEVMRAWKGGAP